VENARAIYDNERKEKQGRKAVLNNTKPLTNLNELISYEKAYHLMTVNLFSLQRKYIPTRYHLFQARYSTHKSLLTLLRVWQIDMHHVPMKQV